MSTFSGSVRRATLEPSTKWYGGVTLQEYTEILKQAPGLIIDFKALSKRLRRWEKAEPAVDVESILGLSSLNGWDRHLVCCALGATPFSDLCEKQPEWVELWTVAEEISRNSCGSCDLTDEFGIPPSPALSLFHPLIRQAVSSAHDLLQSTTFPHGLALNMRTFISSATEWILRELNMLLVRTLALEVNCSRVRGELTGQSSEDRFRSYVEGLALSRSRRTAIFYEYPLLLRFATERLEQWSSHLGELISRLCVDWVDLRKAFFGRCTGALELVRVNLGNGDTHCGGRSVTMLEFVSELRCIYKPRPISAERHFADFLAWFSQFSELDLLAAEVLDRDAYGWAEFLAQKSCNEMGEVQRFYKRLGYLALLLHILNASDMHHENLIAHGEYPVVADLETIFSPEPLSVREKHSVTKLEYVEPGFVARSGLLPSYVLDSRMNPSANVSGIAGEAESGRAVVGLGVENGSADTMRISELPMPAPTGKSLPKLRGQGVDRSDFRNDVIEGFEEAFRIVVQNKQQLLVRSGPIEAFANDRIRFVVRSTNRYARIRFDLYHPDILRDAMERLRLWISLYKVGVPAYRQLVWSEIHDLEAQDVPYFFLTPASTELCSHSGATNPAFFVEPPITAVRRKILEISPAKLPALKWEFEMGLTAPGAIVNEPQLPEESISHASWASQALAAVEKIVSKLCDAVSVMDGRVECHGYTIMANQWRIGSIGPDLYDGLAGVALFLAYAGNFLERSDAKERALAITRFISLHLNEVLDGRSSLGIGAFMGVGGLIYLLTHVAKLLDKNVFLADSLLLSEFVAENIHSDKQFDVISGCAGCIAPLLALSDITGSTRPTEIARQCADHLISSAIRTEKGVAWSSFGSRAPLAGFGHGSAGIAWALSLLHETDKCYFDTALAAAEHERMLYGTTGDLTLSGPHNSWTIFPMHHAIGDGDTSKAVHPNSWCRGAAGIGISRTRLWHIENRKVFREDVMSAIATSLHQPVETSHCLCHGEVGNLICLTLANQLDQDPSVASVIEERKRFLLESINARGMTCGSINRSMVPGMMTGIAGIGYGLLWLVEPEVIPNILVLEGPRRK